MLSCLFGFGFYNGETINKFFYVMECCCHLESAVKLILQFHESLTLEVAYQLVHFLIVGFEVSI